MRTIAQHYADALADEEAPEKTKGFEVGYELFGINGRMLSHGEPIRVKAGERVLFHVLNASATEIRSLALGAGERLLRIVFAVEHAIGSDQLEPTG